MTKTQIKQQIKELREKANRLEESVSSTDGPSSENWVSPERRAHYMGDASKLRLKADKLEHSLNEPRTAKGSLD